MVMQVDGWRLFLLLFFSGQIHTSKQGITPVKLPSFLLMLLPSRQWNCTYYTYLYILHLPVHTPLTHSYCTYTYHVALTCTKEPRLLACTYCTCMYMLHLHAHATKYLTLLCVGCNKKEILPFTGHWGLECTLTIDKRRCDVINCGVLWGKWAQYMLLVANALPVLWVTDAPFLPFPSLSFLSSILFLSCNI